MAVGQWSGARERSVGSASRGRAGSGFLPLHLAGFTGAGRATSMSRSMKTYSIFAVAVCLATPELGAQASGTVVDSVNGTALGGATVQLRTSRGETISVVTGTDGHFQFRVTLGVYETFNIGTGGTGRTREVLLPDPRSVRVDHRPAYRLRGVGAAADSTRHCARASPRSARQYRDTNCHSAISGATHGHRVRASESRHRSRARRSTKRGSIATTAARTCR